MSFYKVISHTTVYGKYMIRNKGFLFIKCKYIFGIGHADSRKKQLFDVLRKDYRGQVVLVKGNRLFVSLAYDVNIYRASLL